MNEIKLLILLELRSFYGINKFIYTSDQKFKTRYKRLSIAWIILIGMLFFYVGGLSFGLCSLGLSAIVPAYLIVISSLMIVFFGIFTAGNRIFAQKGYDILASMPIKSGSIVISRFTGHYLVDLALTVAIMLPGLAVYGYLMRPSILFYVFALIGVLFVPVIPLVIATIFGTVITAVSSRMKNKSIAQSALSVLIIVGVMFLSFASGNMTESFTEEQFINLANTISSTFSRIYPPAVWLGEAIVGAKALKLLVFAGLSLAVMALALFIIAKNYESVIRRLGSFSAKHNYKIGKMESRSIIKTMYMREAKRYFASSIYVTNTIVGPILAAIMSVAICIVGFDTLKSSFPFEIDIAGILPFAFSAVFTMMTTTSVSISMEGRQFWVIKSLPITAKALFDSKILFNLSLMLPFYIISQIAFIIALKPTVTEILWLLLIPASVMLFVTVFGITVNLKFHSFDWENEVAVVKQSMSAAIGGFAGFFLSLILGVAVFVTPLAFVNIAKLAVLILLFTATVILYKSNSKAKLENL